MRLRRGVLSLFFRFGSFGGELETLGVLHRILLFPGAKEAECDAYEAKGNEGEGEGLAHAQGAENVGGLGFFKEFDEEAHGEIAR